MLVSPRRIHLFLFFKKKTPSRIPPAYIEMAFSLYDTPCLRVAFVFSRGDEISITVVLRCYIGSIIIR